MASLRASRRTGLRRGAKRPINRPWGRGQMARARFGSMMFRECWIRRARAMLLAGALAFCCAFAHDSPESVQTQQAREKWVKAKGYKVYYTKKFDLTDLPEYSPQQKVSGTIRMWGSNYFTGSPLAEYWEKDFQKYQPEVKFDLHLKTSEHAVSALIFGVDRKSTRLNSSHGYISYAVFCLKKKKNNMIVAQRENRRDAWLQARIRADVGEALTEGANRVHPISLSLSPPRLRRPALPRTPAL